MHEMLQPFPGQPGEGRNRAVHEESKNEMAHAFLSRAEYGLH
jgi:hypothetical protein